MNKLQALTILKNLFFNAIEDNMVSSLEINAIQDWLDEYAVLFCGADYQEIIIPLQKFLDDGDFTIAEIKSTYDILISFEQKDKKKP